MILTGNTVFWKAGLLLLLCMGDWMEWQIAELEVKVPNGQPASQA